MRWKDLPIVAFDTETTGLDPFSGDRVVEVAMVVLRVTPDGRLADRKDHTWLVDPGIPIPRTITQITGIRDDDVAGKPPFAVIAEEVADLLSSGVAVAHNLPFDHAFLTAEFALAGVPWREPVASIDTLDLSMRVFKDARSHKLGDLARRLDISLVEAHRAANDAAACGLAFIEMARRNEVGDDLQVLLDWAEAIGRPPEGALTIDDRGLPIFGVGPHKGQLVAENPLHLAWMEKARERRIDGWYWRFDEPTRRWARRWLTVRTAGRARQNPKSFHAEDWVLDPCITLDRPRGLS
jgi:DNA polymerase III epsilon subunit-like protein